MSQPALLTKTELAQHLRVSERSIENRMRDGMPFVPIGRCKRFDLQQVIDWLCSDSANQVSRDV
jgi:phage terminase Nu1 subunit (DNA packaging protein)